MTKVIKRERKLKNSTALYLDYRIDGKRYQEATDLHIYPQKDEATKQTNKDNLLRFEILRNAKQKQLFDGIVTLPQSKLKIDFIKYYEDYFLRFPASPKRAKAVLKKLQDFIQASYLPIKAIDEYFLIKFKDYLESNLTGETPHNYFKLLTRVIKYATKERIFEFNPATDIRVKKGQGIAKETLTMDEIKLLSSSFCSNTAVKKAFLFSCLTGLRYCDVSRLKWEHINDNKLSIKQAKTGFVVNVPLNIDAIDLIGNPKDKNTIIFELPTSSNGCNKVLKNWIKKNGIDKKITWHCGRHSLATNLVINEADICSIASIMGHRTINSTQRYIKIGDKMQKKAIEKLPLFKTS